MGETVGKRVAIVQSSYIPWRGLFDMLNGVDEFILFDDMQFVKRHWHNRNCIKTSAGLQWLTIPVQTKGRYLQSIDETLVAGDWVDSHWSSICHAYARAACFAEYGPLVKDLYDRAASLTRLSEVNHLFLTELARLIGIQTPVRWSAEFVAEGRKTDRLVSICKAVGATRYLSGPSAKTYIEPEKFDAAGVTLEWMNYDGYVPYPQLHGLFEPAVSVLDLLFNTGSATLGFIRR